MLHWFVQWSKWAWRTISSADYLRIESASPLVSPKRPTLIDKFIDTGTVVVGTILVSVILQGINDPLIIQGAEYVLTLWAIAWIIRSIIRRNFSSRLLSGGLILIAIASIIYCALRMDSRLKIARQRGPLTAEAIRQAVKDSIRETISGKQLSSSPVSSPVAPIAPSSHLKDTATLTKADLDENRQLLEHAKGLRDKLYDAWDSHEGAIMEANRIQERRSHNSPSQKEKDQLQDANTEARTRAYQTYLGTISPLAEEALFVQDTVESRLGSQITVEDKENFRKWHDAFYDAKNRRTSGFDPGKAGQYLIELARKLPQTTNQRGK